MKVFDLASVLSITTGRLMGEMDIVYDILDYMTSGKLTTINLGIASDLCAPILLDIFPQLKTINGEEINEENWDVKLEEYNAIYGNSFDVPTIKEYRLNGGSM